jgi:PAS domain S-box-containing protein
MTENRAIDRDHEADGKEAEVLLEIGRIISSAESIEQVFDLFSEAVSKIIDFDRMTITVLDRQSSRFFVRYFRGIEIEIFDGKSIDFDIYGSVLTRVLESGEGFIFSPNSLDHVREEFPGELPLFQTGLKTIMGFPLAFQGQAEAFIGISSLAPDAYSDSDLETASRVAAQIAGPIAHMELRDKLERQASEAEAMARIGKAISSAPDILVVWAKVGEEASRLVTCDLVSVVALDSDMETAKVLYSHAVVGDTPFQLEQEYSLSGAIECRIIESGQTVVLMPDSVEDLEAEFPGEIALYEAGFKSIMGVPVAGDQGVSGLLFLTSRSAHAFSTSDVEVAEKISDQIGGALANSQLRDELERKLSETRVIGAIGRTITSSPEIEEVYDTFAEQIRNLVQFDFLAIGLLDEGEQNVQVTYLHGDVGDFPWKSGVSIPMAGIVDEQAVKTRAPVLFQPASVEEGCKRFPGEQATLEAGVMSQVAVPLIFGDRVIGVFNLESQHPYAYTENDVEVLSSLANQIAGAVANEKLRVDLENRAKVAEAMARLGQAISSTPHIEEVFSVAAEVARGIIPFDEIGVGERDANEHETHVLYAHAFDKTAFLAPDIALPGPRVMEATIVTTGKSVLFNPQSAQDVMDSFPDDMRAYEFGYRSHIGSPIFSDNGSNLFLFFASKSPNTFTAEHVAYAEEMCTQIGGAIANAKLGDQLAVQAKEGQTIAEIGRVISSSDDIGEVYPRFAELAKTLVDFDRLNVSVVDETGDLLVNAYVYGEELPGYGIGRTSPIGKTFYAGMAGSFKSILINDEQLLSQNNEVNPSFADAVKSGFLSTIAVPLVVQKRLFGILGFRSKTGNAYTNADLQLAERVSAQVAGAIAMSELNRTLGREAKERELLAEIGRTITGSIDINEVYDRFASQVSAVVPFDNITITRLKPGDESIEVAYTFGEVSDEWKSGQENPLEGSSEGEVFRAGTSVIVDLQSAENVAQQFPLEVSSFEFGQRSLLAAPLRFHDQVIGFLTLGSKEPDVYSDRDMVFVERTAAQIAGAMVNSHMFSQLRDAELEQRELFENAPIGYHELDSDGRIVRANQTILNMLGYAHEDYVGHKVFEFVAQSDLAHVRSLLGSAVAMQGEDRLHTEDRSMVKADGSVITVDVESRRTIDDQGRIKFRIAMRDVTDRNRLQLQLMQAQKMEAVGQLAGGVAHDFNNALTAVMGFTELARVQLEGEGHEAAANLEKVQDAAERAASLTRQLLTFSRQSVVKPEPVVIDTILTKLKSFLGRVISEEIEMSYDLRGGGAYVTIDPVHAEQVITNMVINGSDAMPSSGKLTITTALMEIEPGASSQYEGLQPGPHLVISFADTGQGIAPESLPHIFDPFYTTKRPGEGTGLGLATSYGIVTEVGGKILVDSAVGEGTRFDILLPVSESQGDEGGSSSDKSLDAFTGTESVLLVEDEPLLREVAKRVLESRGYVVTEAENGVVALERAREHAQGGFDVLVTDVVMPLMGGKELAGHILMFDPNLKVVFTSGYTGVDDLMDGLPQESVVFLPKPYVPSDLLSKIREIIDL